MDSEHQAARGRAGNRPQPSLSTEHREAMWQVVRRSWSEQAAHRERLHAVRVWGAAGLGLAATLVVGVFIGRSTVTPVLEREPGAAELVADPIAIAPTVAMPYRLVVDEHFQRAETLLVLFDSAVEAQADAELVRLAGELAATTRLLMDSRLGRDAELRSMLLDLELLLVQIARLVESGDPAEIQLVRESIRDSEVLGRLRRVRDQHTSAATI